MKDRNITALYVFPDHAAAKAGVKSGDIILQIDGVDGAEFSLFEVQKALAERERVRVTFRRPERDGRPSSQYTVELVSSTVNALLPRSTSRDNGKAK